MQEREAEAVRKFALILGDYGFVPWQAGGMTGWHRHVDFVKDCLAGEICRYSADDYIILRHAGRASEGWLKANCGPKEDVVKQRFLLLDCGERRLEVKSFWLGLRGWLEILHYREGDREKRFADLICFAEKLEQLRRGQKGGCA